MTLAGDAVHTMPPFGARGANTALRDARVLAEQLTAVARGAGELLPALGAYQTAMLRYGFEAVGAAQADMRQLLGPS